MNEILETKDYPKGLPSPIILPEQFITTFEGELTKDQIEGLREGKIVLIKGLWTILNRRLPLNA